MPGWLIAVIAIVVFVGFVGILLYRRKKKKVDEAWKKGAVDRALQMTDKRPADVTTPGGVPVWFEAGADRNIDLAAIDRGRENTFRKLECAGYQNINRAQHKPKVAVLASILAPESGTPAYKEYIWADSPYYQSEWDMEKGKGLEVDHYVLASGTMVAVGVPFGDVIAVAHPHGDTAFLERIVDFETEHLGLAWYDGPKFDETKVHGAGRGHPLLDPCPEDRPLGFAAMPVAKDVSCVVGTFKGVLPKRF